MLITTIIVESTANSAQTNVPLTFGQVFAKGKFPALNAAVALVAPNGTPVPCQIDVKATHRDGTIKHAVLSAIIPSLAAGASVTYGIESQAVASSGTVAVPADFPGLNATATITDTGTDLAGPNAGTVYTANAAARLAAGQYEIWLSGPIVSEWIVRVPLVTAGGAEHPDLHARFSIRAYKGQARAKIDYVIENNWAKPKTVMPTTAGGTPWESVSITPRIYAFSLKAGTSTVDARALNGYHRVSLTYNGSGTYDSFGTGVPNDGTVYTATATIDGVAKAISLAGSAIQTYGQLYAAITAQLGGKGVCVSDEGMLGLRIKSNTTGAGSSVVISPGTLFPALKQGVPYRPIRGDEFIHYPATRWKKTFWWGATPSVHVRHNKGYLIAIGAVPNYAADLTGSASSIAAIVTAIETNGDIGRNGVTKAFMGDQGYAPGIGILPEWTALYLVNQGADIKAAMLKQADLQGSWPVHAREFNTDRPISFEKWPFATWSPSASDSRNPATTLNEKLPTITVPAQIPSNANKPDVAHHPDFCFVPYMVTGDHYYLESLLFYFAYLGLSANAHSTYRDGRKCLWMVNQVRGMGWSMRTAGHARYLVPDTHPLRSDIEYMVEQNVLWYNSRYVDPAGAYYNIFGHFGQLLYSRNGASNNSGAPWQEDFVTMSVGRNVELGYDEFLPLLGYKSKQIKGRLTSGAAFCWQLGANYTLQYRDTSSSPLYASWSEVYTKGFSSTITSQVCGSPGMAAVLDATESATILQNDMVGNPASAAGYPANMQPAVAYCATYDMPSGKDAWEVFDNRNQKPDYNVAPQFAIYPREVAAPELPQDPDPAPDPSTTDIEIMIADNVQDSTTSTGTGNLILAGTPMSTFHAWYPSIPIGKRAPYVIRHQTLNERENGFGHLSSEFVFVRDEITSSTNNGQPVPFSPGLKYISCDLTAAFVEELAGKHNATVTALSATPAETLLLVEVDGNLSKIRLGDVGVTFGQLPLLPGGSILDTDEIPVTRGGVDYRAPRSYLGTSVPADTTAPTLTGASATATGQTTATATVTTNEGAGTLYCLISTASTATAAQVKAGLSQAVTSAGAKTFSRTGLTAATVYYPHFMQVDAAATPNESAVATGASFTTAATASTVTGVAVTPTSASLTGGTTQQFSATVSGTNTPSQGVNWSTNLGTITAGGLYTAPAAMASAQTATITATSSQDGTKAGTATVTIAATAATVTYGRLTTSTGVSSETGTGPYTYTSVASGGFSTQGGISQTKLQSGVDGSFSIKNSNIVELVLGVTASTTPVTFTAMPYALYSGGSGTNYTPYASGTAATAQTPTTRQAGDIVRFRRAGTTLFAEVARSATPTTFTTVHSWTGVSTGVFAFDVNINSSGTFQTLETVGLA